MKIIPIGKRVVLKPVEKAEKTLGGIYVPQSKDENDNIGQILDSGELKSLNKGDIVVYSKFAATEIKRGLDRFLIVDEKDILGVIKED